MITPQQAKERLNGIGASDAPIITGHSTFMTGYELYKIKRGEIEQKPSGIKADIGNIMESAIADIFTLQTGIPTVEVPDTIYHPNYPFIFCHIDRIIKDVIPLEIKNTTMADLWGHEEDGPEGIPIPVYVQVSHQMACTGASMAAVACLLFGYQLRVYYIPRDDELIGMIVDKELKFWDCVQNGTPPEVQYNHTTTLDLLRRIYKHTNEEIITLSDSCAEWHKQRTEALIQERQNKSIADTAKAHIAHEMGENAIGKLSDGTCYTRKPNKKGVISLKHAKYTPKG